MTGIIIHLKSIFMARLTNGILSPFIGTESNVTGYMMNGKNFGRPRRRKSVAPMTPKRLTQHFAKGLSLIFNVPVFNFIKIKITCPDSFPIIIGRDYCFTVFLIARLGVGKY